MSLLFENRRREHIFSVREVEFNISQEKIKYSGKAYSVYFEFDDIDAITYIDSTIIPSNDKSGSLFLKVNVAPKDKYKTDLFALPINFHYSADIITLIGDLSEVLKKLKISKSENRNWIYEKMTICLGKFLLEAKKAQNEFYEILKIELTSMITLMDFNFDCCLENALNLAKCALESPDLEEACEECPAIYGCVVACFDFITLPECLICFSLDAVACAYCAIKVKECTDYADQVIECCK